MELIEQIITSFIASGAFGMIFSVPKESLFKCGFVGMVGWISYFILTENGVDIVIATGIASFIVAVISQIFAKLYKTPIIIFTVSGIIPLVPGGMAFNAMKYFVENDYSKAMSIAAEAFMLSGAIAIGIVFSEVVNQIIRKSKLGIAK
ncbi:threonine/serine exporter family protein [Bacillus sp. RG28]|uniref:Threonine/serine exporter family protein n=1 Tax=Gottfriedia endophytica TaxID=2820819 RepID=A0A940SL12_9BACI|nr:threonine/serine exporter family protein [Gottfriedia endophytica]MBP0727006.1 threonine/serine exporter family protein [Gottfriedia endophytica]